MATLIDWSTVTSKIKMCAEQYEYDTASRAFGHVLLETLFGLPPDEIEENLTDGPNDRGIDAVIIHEHMEGDYIHLFQFKYVEKFENASNNFPSTSIDKLLSFITDLLKKKPELKDTTNPILWGKVQEIWDSFENGVPKFFVHLAGNCEGLISTELKRLKDSLEQYKIFSIRELTLSSVANLFLEVKEPKITRNIQLVDLQYFERVDGNIRGLIGTVTATDLVDMIRNPDDTSSVLLGIFDENVRVYLTSRNKINRKIIESALSESNREFWYLNNGITMTCDSFDYPAGVRAPRIRMENVQIVNGGQTSNALFEASQMDPDRFKNVLVLVRVYETKKKEISLRIAESTNSQTPIRSRDLRANDDVQRKLEESFLDIGYYYERKANQHKEQKKEARIDALAAGQAYIAFHLEMPSVAGKERGRIFGDLYDMIFSDEITADQILRSLEVYKPIEQKNAISSGQFIRAHTSTQTTYS
jgi:hypothetical protein